jgi:hypothetical protein
MSSLRGDELTRDLYMGIEMRGEKRAEREKYVREFRKLRVGCVPHFHGVDITSNNVLQMGRQSGAIDGGTCTWEADPLRDVEDDGCEAVFVEIDFLVIRDLADCANFEC